MSHRTQITLTDAQYARLSEESSRTGLALAVLIRRALDAAGPQTSQEDVTAALRASFWSWADRDVDGASYVETLRSGMVHRLDS